ncbi:MAG: epoxyqueuosine reductase [Deltaproteobacteria bacterium]|uniref:Epoxyqueuosine reductase n=1 Tax=Candidatus Zymogenus saltonus TaxID=2844893 RepID=A0A9D8KFJ4_9DELT|nr:epoxyqueuosine reductase [Candidatus Zymogenus saltonus]
MDAKELKEKVFLLGADLCGIAPVSRFFDAPEGFHPSDIYPDGRSVVIFASHFPKSTFEPSTTVPYTFVRNLLVDKLDQISFQLSLYLEERGIGSIPIPSSDPYEFWDSARSHGRGIISLKHAGYFAGLGVIGKNTLLMNEVYGNMIWLGGVLVSVDLEPDPIALYEACKPGCALCLDSCPQRALDGITVNQKLCREHSYSYTNGGGWVISCNTCRKVCPKYSGLAV